jgi:radical SAM protein with 4Fe4S-binding SPASM domain
VNWDGGVSPCCIDYDQKGILGTIRENGFSELWNGPALRRLRRRHLFGEYHRPAICGPCEYWLIKEDLGAWLRRKSGLYLMAGGRIPR